jgi:site-specific DNA-methyltransferase (adenine-specific)
MVIAIEDTGFEIRDQIQWLYGSGFPKSHDVSKGIDKQAGAEREEIGKSPNWRPAKTKGGAGFDKDVGSGPTEMKLTAPSTESAKQWQGWGTALKPANEPIVLARKPLEKGLTVAQNVLKWGTGAINVDGCRIGLESVESGRSGQTGFCTPRNGGEKSFVQGRWPANVLLDEQAAFDLDEQNGVLKAGGSVSGNEKSKPAKNTYGEYERKEFVSHGNSGGASRFFYVAKASKRERGTGNNHPTVKPIKLMEYLCRLIAPPKGIILDPFMGSGTTGVAAKNLGFEFIGIEMNPEYIEIAKKRIAG